MDFSSHNPITSNALNLAARNNDATTVRRLLKKMNPNCIDNRGWTCLHEAAENDSFESLRLILKHSDCRPLAETHEGHTALYLACRRGCSIKVIRALLDAVEDIVNYGSTEGVTPLHIVSSQGRVDLIELFIQYGAIINVQDFDGDTPLHDSALESQHESIAALLHAGADPDITNGPGNFTAFHLACCKGCLQSVKNFQPFVLDINHLTMTGDTPLICALQGFNDDIIHFLLDCGADPHIRNSFGDLALDVALNIGYTSIFDTLLAVTDKDKINLNIILVACKPHNFKFEILEALMTSDLGPEYFDFVELFHIGCEKIGDYQPHYYLNAPLNSYLNITEYIYNRSPDKFREFFYLFLMRGVKVDAADISECPPLVYIHYCVHNSCFRAVFELLMEHGCNVDYCSSVSCLNKDYCLPDVFHASITTDPTTLPVMLPYSVHCEPDAILKFAYDNGILGRIPMHVQTELINTVYSCDSHVTAESLQYFVPPLKHLARLKIRSMLRNRPGGIKSTKHFLKALSHLPVPLLVRNYLRYF